MSTLQLPTNEERALVYKALAFSHNTSFYLWTCLILFTATIFAGKGYFSNEILKSAISSSLVQTLFFLMALPIGLLLWRYARNKVERNIFLDKVYHQIGDTNTNKDVLLSLSKDYNRTVFSVLQKVKTFFCYLAFLELYLTLAEFAATSKKLFVTADSVVLLSILLVLIAGLNIIASKIFLKTISNIEKQKTS